MLGQWGEYTLPWKEAFSQFGWMTTYTGNDVVTGYAKEIKPGSFGIKLS